LILNGDFESVDICFNSSLMIRNMDYFNISVIIPLYNKEKYIKKTIESVLNQSYPYFELIVVDDGSTDNSANIVSKIIDDRIYLLKQKNGGVSKARNHGASVARYDWFIFLDADDVFMQGALENFVALIGNYPRNEVFIANFISKDHSRVGTFRGRKEKIYEKPLRAMWRREFYPHPGNIMCSRNAFKKLGGFDERMCYYEDFEFGVRLIKNYSVVFSPFVCMEYVVDNNEAREKLYPLIKEYAYYMESESIENRWLKNYCFTLFKSFIRRREKNNDFEGARILKEISERKFGKYYAWLDIIYRIRRKLLKYWL